MVDKMSGVASSPWVAVVAAGALLANPGMFIPIALKTISETDPSTFLRGAVGLFRARVPAAAARGLVLLVFARDWAKGVLELARDWLERHAMQVAMVIVGVLAISLLYSGISGLTD